MSETKMYCQFQEPTLNKHQIMQNLVMTSREKSHSENNFFNSFQVFLISSLDLPIIFC